MTCPNDSNIPEKQDLLMKVPDPLGHELRYDPLRHELQLWHHNSPHEEPYYQSYNFGITTHHLKNNTINNELMRWSTSPCLHEHHKIIMTDVNKSLLTSMTNQWHSINSPFVIDGKTKLTTLSLPLWHQGQRTMYSPCKIGKPSLKIRNCHMFHLQGNHYHTFHLQITILMLF